MASDNRAATSAQSKSLPWFRLYHRTIDDDKLRLLAFEDRWHFIALCCLKAEGLLDEPDSDIRTRRIAVKLGVQVRELDEIGRRLQEVDLVDESLCPLAWDELQQRSDSSTERVRKHREKQRRNKVKRYSNGAEKEGEEEDSPKGECPSDDEHPTVDEVMGLWNEKLAPALGKPRIRKLDGSRRQTCKARCAEFTITEWRETITNIRGSPFLRGNTGWQGFGFDWWIKKSNFLKILEGNYNDQPA